MTGPSLTAWSAAGFVVAGGGSLRMGRDKALLPWRETTLLDHAIARLRAVAEEVVLLGGDTTRYAGRGLPVVADARPGYGPLAGVLAGLEHLPGRGGVFLAVDLPRVPAALLAYLLDRAHGHDAVVPVSAAGREPLCAVYGPGCAEPIRRRLERGERSMTCFWPDVRVLEVELRTELGFGEPEQIFLNVNSPEDYDLARRER